MYINKGFLKFFYNALLTGMPSLTYNPFNKNVLHAPFIVDEQSTYINFRLNNEQLNKIELAALILNSNGETSVKSLNLVLICVHF